MDGPTAVFVGAHRRQQKSDERSSLYTTESSGLSRAIQIISYHYITIDAPVADTEGRPGVTGIDFAVTLVSRAFMSLR